MTDATALPVPAEPAGAPAVPVTRAPATEATARWAGLVMFSTVVIWGFGPPITKAISAPPLVVVSVRFWISAPLVWLLVYLSGRRVSWEVLRRTAVAGALFGVNLLLVVAALDRIAVAVFAVLQALQPGIVLVVAGRLLGERVSRRHVLWTAVGVGGVVVVVLGGDAELRGDLGGFVLAVAALFTFTAYYLGTRLARATTETGMDPLAWMAGVTLVGGLTVTPVALATMSGDDYRQLAGADWFHMLFMAVVVGVVGHTMMSWTHRFIPASRSSLYLLGMNVVSMAAAWPINGEPVRPLQAVGGVVVMGAVAAVVTRPPEPAPEPDSPVRPVGRTGA